MLNLERGISLLTLTKNSILNKKTGEIKIMTNKILKMKSKIIENWLKEKNDINSWTTDSVELM